MWFTTPAKRHGKLVPSSRMRGIVSSHGRALLEIGVVSMLGILATAGFQIVSLRGLGPEQYGLLASFLALINVSAIGSAALRNSVAVSTAEGALTTTPLAPQKKRIDSSMIEALALGGISAIGIVVLSPWLQASLETNVPAIVLTAASILPYFLFARAQGLLQGAGRARSVVWWTTGAQVAQVALAVVAILLGLNAIAILAVVLATAVLSAVGSGFQARGLAGFTVRKPFSVDTSVVLLLTIAFAWLTNIDVVFVRAGAPADVAGAYAAAAVLVKTTLIIPATLSLYLLPRFVSRRNDTAMTRLGVNVTLVITLLSGFGMFAVLALASGLLVPLIFGPGYQISIDILPWFALAWLPWAASQGILIRHTAANSKSGLAILLAAVVAQWFSAAVFLPDVFAMIAANGCIGLLVFICLYVSHLRPRLLAGSPTAA